ncbi:MAG: hypothetical protein ABIR62_15075 [Dokdonella sp.]|uniref:hypothetical protein n=1 Tax=Dokdonella sp. TaxID=2291710 RepID=UPI0032660BD0
MALATGCCLTTAGAKSPPTDADDILDASKSASLAGVVHDEDATAADLAADATYLLPGFIKRDITLDNLRRRFGKTNVSVATIDGAEGETAKGFVLFPDDPARRAELFVQDEERLRGISSIRVSGDRSRWHLESGVRPGMSLDDLVALNGKAITFTGLDWDYGGSVADWNRGRLAQRAGEPVFRSVSLTHRGSAPAGSYPSGEEQYRSNDQRYPKQGSVLFVGQLMVSFSEGKD